MFKWQLARPQIGIWGPKASGKTSYLSTLYLSMNETGQGWSMKPVPGDQVTRNFANKSVADMRHGRFPEATTRGIDSIETILRFDIKYNNPSGTRALWGEKKYQLTLLDVPGGRILAREDPDGYFQYLQACQGILLMVDVGNEALQRESTSYSYELSNLLEKLATGPNNKRGKLSSKIAFCSTKMDLDNRYQAKDSVEQYIKEFLPEIYEIAMQRCYRQNLGFFPISIVGRYPTRGGYMRPNVVPAGLGNYRIANPEYHKHIRSQIYAEIRNPLIFLL